LQVTVKQTENAIENLEKDQFVKKELESHLEDVLIEEENIIEKEENIIKDIITKNIIEEDIIKNILLLKKE